MHPRPIPWLVLPLLLALVASCAMVATPESAPSDEAASPGVALTVPGPSLAAEDPTCAAPEGYTEVSVEALFDEPAALAGQLVTVRDFMATLLIYTKTVCPKLNPCCTIYPLHYLRGPVGSAAEPLRTTGAEASWDGCAGRFTEQPFPGQTQVWGTVNIDEDGLPTFVIDGTCAVPGTSCGLYAPSCPGDMTCEPDDCGWNGGDCGINPPGTCIDAPAP